ncbi:SDR family oxidoreductase [Polyangium aurulentum]|uniref:SDR family oxidoreductase n=1 Tax=Polyangium aurulentum TaxID=2567896 RepID=UPI0010AE598B|nr:SDR family oxidoreductase [Polyangium aurulentum]UQA59424.1 SDR family oxidoreductase [Polyangium aurulentum]
MRSSRRDFLRFTLGASTLAVAGCGGVAADPAPQGPVTKVPVVTPPPAEKADKGGPKRILILGGTGFLGPQLVEAARARGHTLTLFNRGKTRPELFPDIEKLQGDRDGDLKALAGRKWDAVVDTSGYVPRVVKMSAELLAPNVGHYVFVSSISVFADPVPIGADESAPVDTMADEKNENVKENYGALKALCEKAAEAAMPGRVTNVRPGLIVGPGDPTDRFTYWPVRVKKGGDVLAPGTGDDPVQFIDARDLAAWIILAIEQKHLGVYNATGPENKLVMREFLETCKRVSGSDARFVWVDYPFLVEQKVSPWTDMPVWATPTPDHAGFSQISSKKAIERGMRFRPLDETVKDTLAWYDTLPEERRSKKMRAGLTPEREAEVLAAWAKKKSGGDKKDEKKDDKKGDRKGNKKTGMRSLPAGRTGVPS